VIEIMIDTIEIIATDAQEATAEVGTVARDAAIVIAATMEDQGITPENDHGTEIVAFEATVMGDEDLDTAAAEVGALAVTVAGVTRFHDPLGETEGALIRTVLTELERGAQAIVHLLPIRQEVG
jgi:hypothetical protein